MLEVAGFKIWGGHHRGTKNPRADGSESVDVFNFFVFVVGVVNIGVCRRGVAVIVVFVIVVVNAIIVVADVVIVVADIVVAVVLEC